VAPDYAEDVPARVTEIRVEHAGEVKNEIRSAYQKSVSWCEFVDRAAHSHRGRLGMERRGGSLEGLPCTGAMGDEPLPSAWQGGRLVNKCPNGFSS
jgi:hypothetical protein